MIGTVPIQGIDYDEAMGNAKVTVSVPIVELEKLEQSRIQLFEFINEWVPADKQHGILTPLLNITKQIWIVANRRDWNE